MSSTNGGGKRLNTGKLRLELVPTSSIRALAEVLQAGAAKYDDRNWEKGMKWTIVYACAMRHLLAWYDGEDLDPESKLNHLKHVLANISFLIEYEKTCPNLDDRPSKEK